MIDLNAALIEALIEQETARIRTRSAKDKRNDDAVRLAESRARRLFGMLRKERPATVNADRFRLTESAVMSQRGRILKGLRGGLGGTNYPIRLIREGVDAHGHEMTDQYLAGAAREFEGCDFVVRVDEHGLAHTSPNTRPHIACNDEAGRAGFVHSLEHRPGDGIRGELHVYEDEPHVRELIEAQITRRGWAGLSVEGRGTFDQKAKAWRVPASGNYVGYVGKVHSAVVLCETPAAGGRIFGTKGLSESARDGERLVPLHIDGEITGVSQ